MPAHITALYPFLCERRLGGEELMRLRELCAERQPLEVAFTRTGRFPGVLYLAPEPSDGLRRLTLDLVAQWPEAPPYRGAFAEVVPHLTVAHEATNAVLDTVQTELARSLPITATLAEARVYVFDGARWRVRERLPLGRRR